MIKIIIVLFSLVKHFFFWGIIIPPWNILINEIPIIVEDIHNYSSATWSIQDNYNRYLSMKDMWFKCWTNTEQPDTFKLDFDTWNILNWEQEENKWWNSPYAYIHCKNIPWYIRIYTIPNRDLKIMEPIIDDRKGMQYYKNIKWNLVVSWNFLYSNTFDSNNWIALSEDSFIFTIKYDWYIPDMLIQSTIIKHINNYEWLWKESLKIEKDGMNTNVFLKKDFYSCWNKNNCKLFSYIPFCNLDKHKCIIKVMIWSWIPKLWWQNISYFWYLFPFYSNWDYELIKSVSGININGI
jgi:hypothetical protein